MSFKPDTLTRLRDFASHSLADVQVYHDLMNKSRARAPKADAKLQVIGAGFSRTATLSMYAAMLELGYKCYHGIEMECAPGVSDKWIRVLEHDLAKGSTKGIDWAQVTQGYDAGFDAPFADYWLELSRVFPDAKIVYTHRDGQKWIESYNTAVIGPMTGSIWFKMATFWFPRQAKILKVAQLIQDKYDRDFGGLAPNLIDRRLEAIKAEIPPERLLVFHPSQGWEPLCRFLGVPIPDTPFPKMNDGPSMVWALRAVSIVGMAIWGATLAIGAGAGMWFYSRVA